MAGRKRSWNLNIENSGGPEQTNVRKERVASINESDQMHLDSSNDQEPYNNPLKRTYSPKHVSSTENTSYQNSLPGQLTNVKLSSDIELQSVPIEDKIIQNKYGLYKGVIFAALSSIFFSLSSVIVKYTTQIHPGQLAVTRFIGILVFTMPVMIYKQQAAFGPKNSRHYLVLRGLVGASSLYLRFLAFRYLPIADASVIVFSVPVFVAIFARIFLKEPCGIFHVVAIVITLIGVFLITKMPLVLAEGIVYSHERLYGVLAAIGSTFFGAAVYVVIRKIKFIHHSVIMFNFGWVAIIETVIITFLLGFFTLPQCGLNQWLILLLGVCSFFGQTLLTLALQEEQAAAVAIVRAAVDIVLAFIWQILFFQETPDVYSVSGAILVSFCILLISVRKWVLSLPEDSKTRKRLSYFSC